MGGSRFLFKEKRETAKNGEGEGEGQQILNKKKYVRFALGIKSSPVEKSLALLPSGGCREWSVEELPSRDVCLLSDDGMGDRIRIRISKGRQAGDWELGTGGWGLGTGD